MGRSKESFGKKEVRNKKEKKRKEKEKRRLEKKDHEKKSGLDDMMAWVDENGVICSTPPDPANKTEIDPETIEIGIPKAEDREEKNKRGKVKTFDEGKAYGFISSSLYMENLFFHINDCIDEVRVGDMVEFETEQGPRGLKAVNVKRAS